MVALYLDELAGLRDSAPPTINDDPTSSELASLTGIDQFLRSFNPRVPLGVTCVILGSPQMHPQMPLWNLNIPQMRVTPKRFRLRQRESFRPSRQRLRSCSQSLGRIASGRIVKHRLVRFIAGND